MLQIREEHDAAFREEALIDYQDRMLMHLERFFPEHCEALGEENTRLLIEHGIERAATYDIVSERDVCLFIDLMLALGVDFDESDKYPWARELLTDENAPEPRIDAVHDRAMRQIEQAG